MILLRNIIRSTYNILSTERCFVLKRNTWNVENHFGSKVELPSPPKRPLSAYMIFCKDHRQQILKDNPSLSSPEQIKVLAEKWSHLTEDMKKPYELNARLSTQKYGEEHKKFYESLTEEQKGELARLKAKKLESRRILRYKKALRDSGLPKAPSSAYNLFVQSESKNDHDLKQASDFIKKAAELWNALPEESKKVYEKQAEEDKIRYVEEMKKWRTKILMEGNKKILKAYEELKGRGGRKSLDSDDDDERRQKKESETKKKSVKLTSKD